MFRLVLLRSECEKEREDRVSNGFMLSFFQEMGNSTSAPVASPAWKCVFLTSAIVTLASPTLYLLGFSRDGIIPGSWADSWIPSGVAPRPQSAGGTALSFKSHVILAMCALYLSTKLFIKKRTKTHGS